MQGLVQPAAGFEHRGQEVTGPELGDRQVEFPTRARSGWGCRRVCTTPGDASWLQPGPKKGPGWSSATRPRRSGARHVQAAGLDPA